MKIHEFAIAGDLDGVRKELRRGASINSKDKRGFTPLACAANSSKADVEMLRLLVEAGADVTETVDEGKHFPLDLAACSGNLDKVRLLLDRGADVHQRAPKGYTVLINAAYALQDHEALLPMIDLLVQYGVEIDAKSEYGESPLGVLGRRGRFDAVERLLEAGADPAPLGWSPLLKTIALGTADDVAAFLESNPRLDVEDRCGRTPLLLAAVVGDVRKAELLFAQGCQIDVMDRAGNSGVMLAIENGKTVMLKWLIERGADFEAVNGMDHTPLMAAAQTGQDDLVRLLLEAGADASRSNQFEQTAMSMATTEPIIRLLTAAGQDLAAISTEMKRRLIGLPEEGTIDVTPEQYRTGRTRRFGRSNPEVMRIRFWDEMVRVGAIAYQARTTFDDTSCFGSDPVWCFSRFGMSFTELPDGRFVQIGGEHEDFYDPDFCIYNDVVVHERSGRFEIMGYPENVFPPTDFHTATFFKGSVYIIGRLGYHGTRKFGTTPVYRLNSRNWKMQPIVTTGDIPGWIFKHRATLNGSGSIVVSGGTICDEINGEEQNIDNESRFQLDLESMKWTRL